ncbi:ornithine cyclodeaminase [Bacillus sp. FJAT-27231]|uniref:ornithine cyclodeaminase family protein n=1 Tax=Bacillus sp. FJAT-27231 TaxID=1679168 RepID=UPI00067076FD|nr:ornithine cyclodeaminase [Bacillus sp. FJAT-27231]KMY52781.1 ornithine cyclodeaminase [Bacillus sp. FJAT-27231]
MLLLSEKHMQQAASMADIIEAVKTAYEIYDKEQFQMDARTHLSHNEDTLLLMPCYANQSFGTKIVSVFPHNRSSPVTQGMMILTDGNNGTTKALLNGTYLTGLRTGALGGLAARYLAPEDAHSVGLIGTGVQGFYQLAAICLERPIQDIYLFNRTPEKAAAFSEKIKSHISPHVNIHIKHQPDEVISRADMIVTATTSHTPVLPNDPGLYNGKLVIGVGSFQPCMRELPEELFKKADHLFIDTLDAIQESGDVIDPLKSRWLTESQVIPFSSVVTSKVTPPLSTEKPIVFKSTGMALFDVIAASVIYEKAVEQGIGLEVEL